MWLQNDLNVLKWFRRRARRKSHRDILWGNIYALRQEIVDDVLNATIENKGLDTDALLHKGILVRKYSRRLKYIQG